MNINNITSSISERIIELDNLSNEYLKIKENYNKNKEIISNNIKDVDISAKKYFKENKIAYHRARRYRTQIKESIYQLTDAEIVNAFLEFFNINTLEHNSVILKFLSKDRTKMLLMDVLNEKYNERISEFFESIPENLTFKEIQNNSDYIKLRNNRS